jgi:Xaa-Pro aminopeptidase
MESVQTSVLEERVRRCGQLMASTGLDALLLTKPSNMFYLTGDGRLCAYAMVTREGRVALGVPSTDVDDVSLRAHVDDIAGFEDEVGMIHSIARHFEHFGLREGAVGMERTYLTGAMMHMLTHPHAKPQGLEVKDATPTMAALRLVKEEGEVELMRRASRVASEAMGVALEALKPGMTESQVAAEAEYAMRQAGADGFWMSYVSSGPRTSIAHGLPSQRRLAPGDLVMIDLHPVVDGYSSDICRMACLGRPTQEQRQIHDLYLRAQQASVAACSAGVGVADLERILEETVRGGGHGDHLFGPPIHGIGIDFEEPPLPPGHAFFHGEKESPPLSANVVVAVGNCGIYTGPWGVRVEDTVVIGGGGPEVLTEYPRALYVSA